MNTPTETQNTPRLPANFSERAGKLSDYLSAFELVNAYGRLMNGNNELDDPQLIQVDWQSPGFNPETDIHTIFDQQGRLVGLLETWMTNQPPVHPWNWICVHPDVMDKGIWEYLLLRAETRSQAALPLVPANLRVAPVTSTEHQNLAGLRAIQNQGWTAIRSYYKMLVELEAAPEVPPAPDGIIIRACNPATEAEAVYLAMADSFQDHYGYVDQPFEIGFAEFKHRMIEMPGNDPNYWFVAMDQDEIAGICLCRPGHPEDPECGWVSTLGVRRPWRKKGLGFILLKQAFSAFYASGLKRAGLGVDASSLTGALHLYERAGMKAVRQFDHFEKELRAGIEISTQELT